MSNAKKHSQPTAQHKRPAKAITLPNIEQLNRLDKADLQAEFKRQFPRQSIPTIKHLMVSAIAHHLQAQAYGPMDKATLDLLTVCKQTFLKEKAATVDDSMHDQVMTASLTPVATKAQALPKVQPRISNQLADGTVLKRHFNGRLYEVLVRIEQGKTQFYFQGRHYRSLSKIAEEISGSHYSGPRFFGLTKLKQSVTSIKPSSKG